MNKTNKGNATENQVKKILEQEGWTVFKQHRKMCGLIKTPKGFFPKMVGADFYGCDIIAKKVGKKTLWIQVCMIGDKSSKIPILNSFPWNYEHEDLQIWCKVPRKGFRIFQAPNFEESLTVREDK